MRLYDSELWISDLDEIIGELSELDILANKTVMVTGCTGLIGSAVMDVLVRWNCTHVDKIVLYAAGRNIAGIEERFSPYSKEKWFVPVLYDAVSTENQFSFSCDYIIHGASPASPNKITKEPVETMMSNFSGLKYLMDYARECGAQRVLYISSSEIYGRKESVGPYKVGEYGYIDLLNVRNSYSIGKCAAETLSISYAYEYGVDVVIVRPGHIYGPTALKSDNRVSSTWAYAAARGENIIMKSNGEQIRSYCYCLDCASAILTVLLKGENGHAYNISNPESIINIKQMAELLVKSAGVKLMMETPTEIDKKWFNPMSNSSLDASQLLKLGWYGLFNAERGFSHTVKILSALQ